jgi:hypothetical protein
LFAPSFTELNYFHFNPSDKEGRDIFGKVSEILSPYKVHAKSHAKVTFHTLLSIGRQLKSWFSRFGLAVKALTHSSEVQSLHGKLMHACHAGRAYLL